MTTFNILIASIGRPTLINMLNSLKYQLTENDCISIVFDGIKPDFEINTNDFMCKVFIYYETETLGYWGHGIRNKYSSLLEKRDFILHANDDDVYLADAFKMLRTDCVDTSCLYIAKINLRPFEDRYVPEDNSITSGKIGTPNGIIPYELNKKSSWGLCMGGDFDFYDGLGTNNIGTNNIGTNNIVYLNHIIYQIKPHLILDFISNKYKLDKNISSGCHNYIPGYASLFDNRRDVVHNLLEIGIGSCENGQMGGVIHLGYKTGNSLKCWSEYFPNSKVYGIDIFEHKELNTDKIITFVADQSSASDLQNVIDNINCELDIIIDDGSHQGEHQVFSFMFLNKFLSKNGIYVIEDVQPNNIDKFIDLTIFPDSYRNYINENFLIKYFDTRNTIGRADDFIISFTRKFTIE